MIFKFGELEIPSPGNPNMYRALIAYLYSVALDVYKPHKKWKPMQANFLPLIFDLSRDPDYTGADANWE